MTDKIRLGISTCLLGRQVRYDGTHQRDAYLVDTLGPFVDYVPVCPEVECGLPVPRDAMRLVGDPQAPRLVTVKGEKDLTEQMQSWAARRLNGLAQEDLCGFIFKKGSPSSGLHRVKVYQGYGMSPSPGRGIFAALFVERFPDLPVEEDMRLYDPGLRENFIVRVFTLRRWRAARRKGTTGALVDFHTRNKLLILSHSETHYRQMGPLAASGKKKSRDSLFAEYENLLLQALQRKTTVPKNINVLQHVLGYFKKVLSPAEKQECLDLIERYRDGQFPLIVPITLLNHYVLKYEQTYLADQTYLRPHPLELRLRNHV